MPRSVAATTARCRERRWPAAGAGRDPRLCRADRRGFRGQQKMPGPHDRGRMTGLITGPMLRIVCFLLVALGLIHGERAFAATPEQAQAMAEKAAAYLEQNGPEKAFAAIEDRAGEFRDGDLYVFVHDSSGLVVAHGGYSTLRGKNTLGLTDIDGKPFVREMV